MTLTNKIVLGLILSPFIVLAVPYYLVLWCCGFFRMTEEQKRQETLDDYHDDWHAPRTIYP